MEIVGHTTIAPFGGKVVSIVYFDEGGNEDLSF